MKKHRFQSGDEVMVTRLTPYLLDLGFKPNQRYTVTDYARVEGLIRDDNDGSLFVKASSKSSSGVARISDYCGNNVTGAGECFGPWIDFRAKKKELKALQTAKSNEPIWG